MNSKAATFGVSFYLKKQKSKDGKAPIYARIAVEGKRAELSIKKWIDIANWSEQKGQPKGNREEIRSLNHYLEQVRGRLYECYQELQLERKLITPTAIKNKFFGLDQREYTLCKLMDYHNSEAKDSLTWGTLKNYFTTRKYLESFMQTNYHTSDMYLSHIDRKFVTDFEYFLKKHQPLDHQRPLTNNGIMKHLERFRKMINLARQMEWINKDPFTNFRLKFNKKERECLTGEELQAIENKEFKIQRLQWVRDVFIFSCYTGLAYIDVMSLTPSNITLGMDGEYWIHTNRQKTSNVVRVPILPKAQKLIDKYSHHPKVLNEGGIFPRISNQKINTYLKEIADVCGIEKNITFHLARHTFATTVTMANGVPIESVSKMLGHTKISTTQVYAKVVEKKLGEDMRALRQKLTVHRNNDQEAKSGNQ